MQYVLVIDFVTVHGGPVTHAIGVRLRARMSIAGVLQKVILWPVGLSRRTGMFFQTFVVSFALLPVEASPGGATHLKSGTCIFRAFAHLKVSARTFRDREAPV